MAEIVERIDVNPTLVAIAIASPALRARIRIQLDDLGAEAFDTLFVRTPVDTGRLQSSVGYRIAADASYMEFGYINDPPDYAKYVEEGNIYRSGLFLVASIAEDIRAKANAIWLQMLIDRSLVIAGAVAAGARDSFS